MNVQTPIARRVLDRRRVGTPLSWYDLVTTKSPHDKQRQFIESSAKRIVVKAGRRGGKTTGMGIKAVLEFIKGRRVLYAAPTSEQLDAFWHEVKTALQPAIDSGYLYKNETEHIIERRGTKNRIRAKTAWNADTLRGDHADLLILDEWQLMDETAWSEVGAPMLLDNDGDAVFIFTPPSVRSRSASKARDKKHAIKLFKRAKLDDTGRWEAFHFTSRDNPYLSQAALDEIASDMTRSSYKQEILAEDDDVIPGALWTSDEIDAHRVTAFPDLVRVAVAIDPAASANEGSDETGIVVCGVDRAGEGYVLDDVSLVGSPVEWARQAIAAYHRHKADRLIAEVNNGGDMVEHTIRTVDPNVSFKQVRASRGKAVRAEPVAALYEQGKIHHVGAFAELEDQLCGWTPDSNDSPDRLDALVWAFTELMVLDVTPDWGYDLA